MTGAVKIGPLTFKPQDFATITVGTVMSIMDRGGQIAIPASAESGHAVAAAYPAVQDDSQMTQKVWTVTCERCGTLGAWDNPVVALQAARQH